MDQITDELIAACQRGEAAAFDQLFALYEKQVYSTVFRMVGNSHDAEDLTQETFLRAFRSISGFRRYTRASKIRQRFFGAQGCFQGIN